MNKKDYLLCKITLPQVKQKVLLRRGIAEIIDNASLDEMIYLVAPFGSGKTMAVLSWLRERGKKAAWVSLGDSEDSPASLWGHIAAAILMFADEQQCALDIFNNPKFNDNPRAFLRETLVRLSPKFSDMTLIIDNFKYVRNGGLLLEVRDLILNILGCWRVIVVGRTELPPIFNDFLLKKCLRLISLDKLNFSYEETAAYFCLNGFSAAQNELNLIYEETDGWPAALNAILTVSHVGSIKYNDTAKAYVTSYFEGKIWEPLSGFYKTFLLKTCILDKLTPSICHYVADVTDTEHILRYLYVNGLFIYSLEESGSYCYHRVFRDFLLAKLYKSGMDVNSLYIKAGWWLYERNESIPALLCFYRSKCFHGINLAFKKVRPAYMGMDEYIKTAFCLTSLDIMELKSHPEVAVRIALLHFLAGNITEMQRIYKVVREWLEPGVLTIPPEEYTDFYWEVGWLQYVDPDEDILSDPRFPKWANVLDYAPHLHENDRARASSLRLPSILRGVRDFSVDVEKALNYYAQIHGSNSVLKNEADIFITDIIFAEICYEREDFEQSEKTIKRIMPMIEREKYTELFFSCIELLVKITRAVHNPREIDRLTERLMEQIYSNGHLFLIPNFHAFALRNRIANGTPGITEEFERDNKPYKDKPYYYLIYRHISYVRALLSVKKYGEASLLLGNLDFLLRQYKRNMDLIEVNILRAITEYGLGHENGAVQHLSMALDAGRKCGFIRIFADDAESLWPVLRLIHKRGMNSYVKKVISSSKRMLSRTRSTGYPMHNTHESLTKAEIRILKLLHTGMSYNEIALANDIKIGTVRSHLHSIYSKLGVDNKTLAIITARKSGIFGDNPLPED